MELSIEVTVECAQCGTELDAQITTHRGSQTLKVDPCMDCADKHRDKAVSDLRDELNGTIDDLSERIKELENA